MRGEAVNEQLFAPHPPENTLGYFLELTDAHIECLVEQAHLYEQNPDPSLAYEMGVKASDAVDTFCNALWCINASDEDDNLRVQQVWLLQEGHERILVNRLNEIAGEEILEPVTMTPPEEILKNAKDDEEEDKELTDEWFEEEVNSFKHGLNKNVMAFIEHIDSRGNLSLPDVIGALRDKAQGLAKGSARAAFKLVGIELPINY